MHHIIGGSSFTADPTAGLYNAHQTPWLGLRGPTLKPLLLRGEERRGRKRREEKRGDKMIYVQDAKNPRAATVVETTQV